LADGTNGITKPLKRGRPKGSPKPAGSGRKRGTPNKTTVATREQILEQCDPLKILADVALGKRWVVVDPADSSKRIWSYPSGDQRIHAVTTLAKKVAPDLRSQELSGPEGGPIQTEGTNGGDALENLLNRIDGIAKRMREGDQGPA
jgi:hypothetical protein